MARYQNLTEKQIQILEPLKKEAAELKKQVDSLQEKLAKKVVSADFDENKHLRTAARDTKRKYEDKVAEIESILRAREEYEWCLSKAQTLLRRADNLNETWEFKPKEDKKNDQGTASK